MGPDCHFGRLPPTGFPGGRRDGASRPHGTPSTTRCGTPDRRASGPAGVRTGGRVRGAPHDVLPRLRGAVPTWRSARQGPVGDMAGAAVFRTPLYGTSWARTVRP
ncbi:hypothetical protein GCM10010249_50630 [Streptomyces roseolilacinus]|uniref:Uncharacterized protein n=1 Tax=Streptomyces roseolilacinus TaxID=66904 RepID=A0A918ELM9_9ACTN|nr:hypothetical protein GCM10010249_50630 [Streptomyces roseolilacinus]